MVSYELISNKSEWSMGVLILVVVDNGLVLAMEQALMLFLVVLILVVVDNGLVRIIVTS